MAQQRFSEREVVELFITIGFPRERVLRELHASRGRLTALMAELDAVFRARALELHPDRGGSLEAMQRLNAARDVLRSLVPAPVPEFQERVPIVPAAAGAIRVVIINGRWGSTSTSTSTSTLW